MLEVQKALGDQGIGYEMVEGPLRPGKRDALEVLSGQRKYPVIEFDDGRPLPAPSPPRWRRRAAAASSTARTDPPPAAR